MKKSHIKTLSKSFLSASTKGLIAFAVFGLSAFVYAAVTYPPNPEPVSGIVGTVVGATATNHSGNLGGYEAMNTLCGAVDPDSHVCSPMEVVNTYNHDPAALGVLSGVYWLNSGAPGNTQPTVNDCKGWTDNTLGVYGNVWSTTNDHSGILPCAASLPVLCCK